MTTLSTFPVHEIAHAYIPKKSSPLRTSAEKHAAYHYTIRIDFKDFFPSICFADLEKILCTKYRMEVTDRELAQSVLFYRSPKEKRYILPIGAPTSPTISNIVMCELDRILLQTSLSIDPKSSITRYADDLYFSTNIRGKCFEFLTQVNKTLESMKSPSLTINSSKTLFLSRGTRRIVNGLYVTPNGTVSIGRTRKHDIKTLIYKFSQGALETKDILKAQGTLAFIQDCEPEYYNKLALKYGDAFFSIKNYKPIF